MDATFNDLSVILARLANLERQHRRWKYACLALFVAAGTGVFVAAQAPKGQRVGVEGLYVTDENQKQRAVFGMSLGMVKEPFLMLYDEGGKPRAGLYPSRLHLWDENGKLRAALLATKEGGRLEFYDEKGKVIVPKAKP